MNVRSLVVLIAIGGAGCVTVRPVVAPANYIPQQKPDLVWVTSHAGEVIPIARPTISGDTVIGQWLGTSESVRLALPQVQMIHARQPDRTRTAWLIASATALAGLIVWRTLNAGGDGINCPYDPARGQFTCS